MERRRHRERRSVEVAELLGIVAEIKERAPDSGIIMIEGELAARSLYASRTDIADALIHLDPIGARIRWSEISPRVNYKVPGKISIRQSFFFLNIIKIITIVKIFFKSQIIV